MGIYIKNGWQRFLVSSLVSAAVTSIVVIYFYSRTEKTTHFLFIAAVWALFTMALWLRWGPAGQKRTR